MKRRALMKKLFLAAVAFLCTAFVIHVRSNQADQKKVDLIIFSFDRPLQLYALLESVEKYIQGIGETHVVFRSSSNSFLKGYELLKNRFSDVVYHQQGNNPSGDFKPLTVASLKKSPSDYVMFAVDDIVVKEEVNLVFCAEALEKYNAYGFYLRLGKNLNYCYPLRAVQPLPPLKEEEAIFSWRFDQGLGDWAYPHTVDMALFRKSDIVSDFESLSYHSPNRLEDMWDRQKYKIKSRTGLCFEVSKIVNMPLNRVQYEYKNRVMNEYSPQDLLDRLLQGLKMDIEPLRSVDNKSAHMEYSPTFIMR